MSYFQNPKIIRLSNVVESPQPQICIQPRGQKRKYSDSFDPASFDDERYGQHISAEYFYKNTGHNVKPV